LIGLALLGAALTLPLAGCWNTRESGSRYQLMYRSQTERPAMPETGGSQASNLFAGPTQGQGRPREQGGATPGIIH
jgi:hypothetical protein